MHSRREVCLALGGMAADAAGSVRAASIVRLGLVSGGDRSAAAGFVDAIVAELATRGYVEPQSLEMGMHFANDFLDRVPGLVMELSGTMSESS